MPVEEGEALPPGAADRASFSLRRDAEPVARRDGPGARPADGSGIGGSVVRVERRWPARPDRLHVLLGNGRVARGQALELRGGQPERWLRGR